MMAVCVSLINQTIWLANQTDGSARMANFVSENTSCVTATHSAWTTQTKIQKFAVNVREKMDGQRGQQIRNGGPHSLAFIDTLNGQFVLLLATGLTICAWTTQMKMVARMDPLSSA